MLTKRLSLIFRISRPILILGGAMQYALGLGLARYFGAPLHPVPTLLGLVIVWGIILAGTYFFAQFEKTPLLSAPEWLSSFWGGGDFGRDSADQLPRQFFLILASIAFIIAGLAFFYLVILGWVTPPLVALATLMVLGMLLYTLPPFQLAYSGFGELLLATIWAYAIPSFAYVLAVGQSHRFLTLLTLPLVLLFLAVSLAMSFPYYATAEKFEKNNLLMRLGWEQGINFHNVFLIFAFLLLGLATLFDLPVRIVIPSFFITPLAGLQIWYLNQIGDGRQPSWVVLLGNALVIYASVLYLLTYTLWVG